MYATNGYVLKQQELPLPTEFEMITAEQLKRELPNLKNAVDVAIQMVKKWDQKRAKLNLKNWNN